MGRDRVYLVAPAIRVPFDPEELPRLTLWHAHQQALRRARLDKWCRERGVRLSEPDSTLHSPHFGLLALGAWLERDGHDVVYLDQEWLQARGRWDGAFESMVDEACAIFVGGITVHYRQVCDLMGAIRNRTNAIIVAGGHHATYRATEALDAGASLVVRGEGELAASAIAALIRSGQGSWHDVPGCTFRSGGHVVRTPARQLDDLSTLPAFPFHLLEEEQRATLDLYVFPSRGCSYSCTFCAEGRYWGGHRMVPADRLCSMIERHQAETPFNVVYLYDSSFGDDRSGTLAFCKEFAERFPQTYLRTLTRVDLLDDELLKAMGEARVVEVLVGIESADEAVRARSGKNLANCDLFERLAALGDVVPLVKSSWMIGLPGETRASASATAAMMNELHRREFVVEASCRVATYYPGTPCFEHPETYGLRFHSQDWSRFHRRCRPAYDMKDLTADDIYGLYCEAMSSEIKAMAARLQAEASS